MDKKKAFEMLIAELKDRIIEVDQYLTDLKEIHGRINDVDTLEEIDQEIKSMEETRGGIPFRPR